jgi:superfamily II DNA or RNA helicase
MYTTVERFTDKLSDPAKWFVDRQMTIYDYQDQVVCGTDLKYGDKLVWAVSPNGGKTEMAICYADCYLSNNPKHKILVLTRNNSELRQQFFNRVESKKPNFTYQMVTADNDIDFTKQVIISLPSTLNKRKLPKFDLIVIDEAHHYYESEHIKENSQVKRIIERCGIKKELLLTGTPSYFIRQNQLKKKEIYKFIFVPMSKIYDVGNCSDVIVEMATSSHFITDSDYRRDDLKDTYNFNIDNTYTDLDRVNEEIYKRVTSNFKDPKQYVNKKLYDPISRLNPIDWSIFKKGIGKGLIACKNQSQAKQTAQYYIDKGIDVALSISDTDLDGAEITRFIEESNCKILIVVGRGILGFSFNELEFVVDLSLTKNIDKMYQLFCRATRKMDGVTKLFIKVVPSDREPHFRLRLTGMLCLMHQEWFSKFNGKNFEDLPVPSTIRRTGAGSGGGGTSTKKSKKEPFPMLGLPSMEILKDLYTKKDEIYSPVCWSNVGTILRYLNSEIGKRGVLNHEVIEDFYKSFSGKKYMEMYQSGSHIISKAKNLGIHDGFVQKHNIIMTHVRYDANKNKYKPLLECLNMKDAVEKGHKSLYNRLRATKDKELIKKYTSHFQKLRPDDYTLQMGLDYIESLIDYPQKTVDGKDINNGIYRYVFNRNKDKFYDTILNKFGDMVPMLFLKDEDKLKRIEKQIGQCKSYSEWYKKYKSSHNDILVRLNKTDLISHLNETKMFKNYSEEVIHEIMSKYVGKKWQDVRKTDSAFLSWLYDRNELKNELFIKYKMIEDPRWTKRKNKTI